MIENAIQKRKATPRSLSAILNDRIVEESGIGMPFWRQFGHILGNPIVFSSIELFSLHTGHLTRSFFTLISFQFSEADQISQSLHLFCNFHSLSDIQAV